MSGRHLGMVLAGVALGAASLAIARAHPGGSLGGGSPAGNVALFGAGLSLVVTGAAALARRTTRRFGALLAAAGFAWFFVELNNPGIGSGLAFTVGLVTYAGCPPLAAHAALVYPGRRLSSALERTVVSVAYGAAFGVLGLASAVVFDPARQGCSQCPANHLELTSDPGLLTAVQRVGVWLGFAATTTLAGLALWGVARASAGTRRLAAPVLLAAVAYLALVAADYAHSLGRGFLSNDDLDQRLWLGQGVALLALALGVMLPWVRVQRARDAVAGFVVELGDAPTPGGLRDALARVLGDPDLVLAYPTGDDRHVDAEGRSVELGGVPGRVVTPVVRAGRCVAVLGHRAGLLDDPALVEDVAATARLALDHERLQAERRAQLEALRASRARTVEAGDAERRRLERDLHDGAQQRLVVLALGLRLLRDQLGLHVAARLDAAETELHAALEDLRELGRGIYPAVLADEGLAAAVESLAEAGSAAITVGPMPPQRLAPAVETAAYFLIAAIVKRSGASRLAVSSELSDGWLFVEIVGDGISDADLADLKDRIGALDGELTADRTGAGRLTVRAEVPCES
ncbi:MAG: histidine kinase [Actinomycetota bacterium]|nr:histidine kinase [Actinomycetota bacterium]